VVQKALDSAAAVEGAASHSGCPCVVRMTFHGSWLTWMRVSTSTVQAGVVLFGSPQAEAQQEPESKARAVVRSKAAGFWHEKRNNQ
jgi:hypothetical protein